MHAFSNSHAGRTAIPMRNAVPAVVCARRSCTRLASSERDSAPVETADQQNAAVPDTQQQHGDAASNGASTPAPVTAAAVTTYTTEGKKSDDKKEPAWDPEAWKLDASSLAPLEFKPLDGSEQMWTNIKLAFALPWRRFKKGAVLSFKVRAGLSGAHRR